MSPFLEKHIADLLSQKDERGISLLYDHYGPALYGCILKLVKNEDIANDVLQESLIKIWKKGHTYNSDKSKLFTWVFQISRNTAIDHLRKIQKKNTQEIQIDKNDVQLEERHKVTEENESLHTHIDKLEEKYQIVLDAVFFKGMTHVEAAEYLDMPLGTFKTRIRTALTALRAVIKITAFILLTLI